MLDDGTPLFVVGLPRSGTTLLRNLLHGHSCIALTAYESHFLPGLVAHCDQPPLTATAEQADKLLGRFKSGLLYRKDRERHTFLPSDVEIRAALTGGSWKTVLRQLFDLYCEKDMSSAAIWGDKTPAYVGHMDVIDRVLPDARFVHIIRDPRDQALSERAIWGKSLRRSASTWRERIMDARTSGPAMAGRYLELTYEGLVRDAERELRRLTAWLGVEFEQAMLDAAANSDELGQMVGAQHVSAEAIGGRRGDLSRRDELTISSLTYELGIELAYNLPDALPGELGGPERAMLAAYDRLALLGYFIRTKGLSGGLRFFLGSYVDSRDI